MRKYGASPLDLGMIDIHNDEMLFYMYLPVKLPGTIGFSRVMDAVPKNLRFLEPLLRRVEYGVNDHVYITAKTLYVTSGNPGNRPGWHVDGFGSNGDDSYIWYDRNPTQFAIQEFENISDDDIQSMVDMEAQIQYDKIVEGPCKHLLKLDESVVHRVNPNVEEGMRTFVKISVSEHRYNLKGNAHNYLLDYDWKMYDRFERRNVDNKDYVK